jgi:hypothetical protein
MGSQISLFTDPFTRCRKPINVPAVVVNIQSPFSYVLEWLANTSVYVNIHITV